LGGGLYGVDPGAAEGLRRRKQASHTQSYTKCTQSFTERIIIYYMVLQYVTEYINIIIYYSVKLCVHLV